jgi:hypothetical protein
VFCTISAYQGNVPVTAFNGTVFGWEISNCDYSQHWNEGKKKADKNFIP